MTSSDASGQGGSKARCGRPQQSFRGDAQHRAIVPMLTDDSLGVIPGRPNGGGCLPINSTKINGSLIRSSGCHSQNLTLSASGHNQPCYSLRRHGRSTSVSGLPGRRSARPGRANSRLRHGSKRHCYPMTSAARVSSASGTVRGQDWVMDGYSRMSELSRDEVDRTRPSLMAVGLSHP